MLTPGEGLKREPESPALHHRYQGISLVLEVGVGRAQGRAPGKVSVRDVRIRLLFCDKT